MTEILARIVAPHFVAGIILQGDHVVGAAPIVAYMCGPSARLSFNRPRNPWSYFDILASTI